MGINLFDIFKKEKEWTCFRRWIHSAICHRQYPSYMGGNPGPELLFLVAKLGHIMYPGKSIAAHLWKITFIYLTSHFLYSSFPQNYLRGSEKNVWHLKPNQNAIVKLYCIIQSPWNQLLQLHLSGLQDLYVPEKKNINLYFTVLLFYFQMHKRTENKLTESALWKQISNLTVAIQMFPNYQHFLEVYSKKIRVPCLNNIFNMQCSHLSNFLTS